MKPLSKRARRALKRANPGLTDATIDRTEALLSLRTQVDPERHERDLETLDRRRIELIEREMPNYAEIVRTVRQRDGAERRWPAAVSKIKVTVTRRPVPRKVAGRTGAPGKSGRTPTPPTDHGKRR